MGIFDDLLDELIELPGKVIETSAEVIVRAPEIGIKAGKGLVSGIEKGIDKLSDEIDGDI